MPLLCTNNFTPWLWLYPIKNSWIWFWKFLVEESEKSNLLLVVLWPCPTWWERVPWEWYFSGQWGRLGASAAKHWPCGRATTSPPRRSLRWSDAARRIWRHQWSPARHFLCNQGNLCFLMCARLTTGSMKMKFSHSLKLASWKTLAQYAVSHTLGDEWFLHKHEYTV